VVSVSAQTSDNVAKTSELSQPSASAAPAKANQNMVSSPLTQARKPGSLRTIPRSDMMPGAPFPPRRGVRGRGAQAEGVVDLVLCHRTMGLDHQHHELAQQGDLFLESAIVNVLRRLQRYQFGLALLSEPETLKPAWTHSHAVDSGKAP
jgi:hypothetical protein